MGHVFDGKFPSRIFVGFSCLITYESLGVNLECHVFLVFASLWDCGWALRCTHTMHSTHVCVRSCVCCAEATPLSKLL